jgi:hypothetical protein
MSPVLWVIAGAVLALGPLSAFGFLLYFSYLFPRDASGGYSMSSRLAIAAWLFALVFGLRRPGRGCGGVKLLYR